MSTAPAGAAVVHRHALECLAAGTPERVAGVLRNSDHYLMLPAGDGFPVPLGWALLAAAGGDVTRASRGKPITPADRQALSDAGWQPVAHGEPGFEALWQRYVAVLAEFGASPSLREGRPDAVSRVFWIDRRTAAIAAMDRIAAEGVPKGFDPSRVWFVVHPLTGALFPPKAVWGLLAGRPGSEFNAHHARDALRKLGLTVIGPDQPAAEIAESPQSLIDLPPGIEGAERQVTRNLRERDRKARAACEAYYRGRNNNRLLCEGCGIDFGRTYGARGEGFMHFHHLTPLADAAGARPVNGPVDLVPLCPNCHAMVHRGPDLLTPEQLRKLLGR